ncbi:MAG: hypothetical protein P4L84_26375, partial [Isosphaeraceae bacterium]|nr:hypothetical protein [Isosphaeraceae bacterium]
ANAPAGDDRWYLAAGMDDVLTKPISSPRLLQALDRTGAPEGAEAHWPDNESIPPAREPSGNEAAPEAVDFPVEVIVNGLLCELRIWSEEEWTDMPDRDRPAACVFCPGLGWVGAVPKIALN